MNIQKINYLSGYNQIKLTNREKTIKNNYSQVNYTTLPSQINDITFTARVDKGLKRFYEFNKDRMPITVRKYIENLPDMDLETPLSAQAKAFAILSAAATIAEVKELFPDEELFSDLKSIEETNATDGILYTFRENKELLNMFDKSIFKNKEDLTLWIIKKILIEAKTLDEINADFNNEVDDNFLELNKQHGGGDKVLYPGTLKALGIKNPDKHYMDSLRYTRDGYSDMVGEKISQVQRAIWAALTPEQRTAKAVKTVERFEKWWNSMSRDKQLELIAFQNDELKMLEEFHATAEKNRTTNKTSEKNQSSPISPKSEHAKVETSLSKDELFKIWARNNLKIAEANLTEQDREIINNKRMHRQIEIWSEMSPEERTEYINKMRSGSEVLRYTMIQAWNENPEIIVELGIYMKQNQIERPVDILYGYDLMSKQMSELMTDFWDLHPDFGEKLGESIRNAYAMVKEAKNDGRFEQLKLKIMKDRTIRMKETSYEIKNYREIISAEKFREYPDYMQEFIRAYKKAPDADYKTLPIDYLNTFFDITYENLDKECIQSWIKVLKREPLNEEDKQNIERIRSFESPEAARMNRALEATLAAVLYDYTGDPQVYVLSNADCKFALKLISDGNDEPSFFSNKIGDIINLKVINKNIKKRDINGLYNWYMKPISNAAINKILTKFFEWEIGKFDKEYMLKMMSRIGEYISLYGWSNEIIFMDASPYNQGIRKAFTEKFLCNMPASIDQTVFSLKFDSEEGHTREDWIGKLNNTIRLQYNFLPDVISDVYLDSLSNTFRNMTLSEIEKVEKMNTMKAAKAGENVLKIPRSTRMTEENLELLCVEQALGDVLYKATDNPKVYALALEEMMDLAKSFDSVKKFPCRYTITEDNSTKEGYDLILKRKPNYYKTKQAYSDYCDEIQSYLNECVEKEESLNAEEVMYILNPDEKRKDVDKYTKIRIDRVKPYFDDSIQKV